ncbi:MAG: bifunctional folylpolyglutamate synthase/dihydrofolate synthase, partial [Bacteroidaceae bacterium]|nr:bifunctional folylpolyglutamate synthase/dihydrofolate synthase [Bacteroidaceae bacterium]
ATLRIVFAMVDDKDIRSVITLLPKAAVYYLTQPSTHRAIPLPQLRLYATHAQLNATYHPTPQQAFDSALRDASPKDTIIIAGSNYLIADIQTFTQN